MRHLFTLPILALALIGCYGTTTPELCEPVIAAGIVEHIGGDCSADLLGPYPIRYARELLAYEYLHSAERGCEDVESRSVFEGEGFRFEYREGAGVGYDRYRDFVLVDLETEAEVCSEQFGIIYVEGEGL